MSTSSESEKKFLSEKTAFLFLKFEFCIVFLLCFSAIFLMTVGFDEVWVLIYSIKEIFSKNIDDGIPGVATTGGLYTLVESLVYLLVENSVWAYRIFPFLCLLSLVFLISHSVQRFKLPSQSGLLVVSTIFAVPGTLILSSSAQGTLVAILLIFLGIACLHSSLHGWRRIMTVGVLFGLAGATRLECFAIIPAYILWALTMGIKRKDVIFEAMVISSVALIVFALSTTLLFSFYDDSFSDLFWYNFSATGIHNSLRDHSRILNHFIIGNSLFPLYLMVFSTLAGIYLIYKNKLPIYFGILLWFAWMIYIFWVIKSPIPHLRYLWPALFAFALIIGYGIAFLYEWSKYNNQRFLALSSIIVCIILVGVGIVITTRDLLLGETNILYWEWSGETALARSRAFRFVKDQNRMLNYLTHKIPANESVAAIGTALDLEFLSDQKIYPLEWYNTHQKWNDSDLPKKLLITPIVGYYLYLKPEGYEWIKNECEVEVQYGDYSIYKVKGRYPSYDVLECPRIAHPPHP